MKIDRLIGILSILLQEEKNTAPELAKKFEVSRRTINRDIEDLCKAVFEPSMKWHLIEEYGAESIREGLFRIATELTKNIRRLK